ncbi:carboxypeptidase-like regulatory domain-containing protein [Allorhizocola rhizosphaerae]|uniref:carboxypeptidase-like regulatory domain-containing protein n=1 Tax=Allorhizocola rhizosphaerae TaxID=1872709 RepID=UPI000E3D999F|nr:carboxypeptidase-like regulatory domain-containing protein [Allorhizocola rhizosphaerae]
MIRQTWRPLALLAVLALAAATTAAATAHAASASGSLTGRVVTHTGEPAGNIAVTAQRAGGPWLRGSTSSDGTYAFSAVPAGDYTIMVEPVASVRQYVPQQRFNRLAQVFAVREGEATVVNETLLPQGNLAGRFVDFDGSPLAGARVSVRDLDGESFPGTQTDANGSWRIDGVFASRYQVHFSHGNVISQHAYGKVGVATADVVTVAPNTTTTVNDTALARTSVRVTATDSHTGARLTSFNVSIGQRYESTDTSELVIDGIQAGTHEAEVFAEGYFQSRTRVTLTAGQQGHLAAALEPQSFITVRVVDAATGAPVPNFCVAAMTLTDAVVPDSLCGELTDESGNLRIGWLHAGTYQLFATKPRFGTSPDYGSQWVGADGGTGRQLLAQSVRVGTGQTVAGPVIRLDRPGTITGQVSTPDGQLPRNGRVGVLVGHPFAGMNSACR